MHVSMIDAPSDQFGAVTDVSRPIVHKLNQATMQRSTFNALRDLLVWALTTLDSGIEDSLDAFEAHEIAQHERDKEPLARADATTETPVEPIFTVNVSNPFIEKPSQATEPEKPVSNEIVPLDANTLGDTAEDLAAEAELEAALSVAAPTVEATPEVVAEVPVEVVVETPAVVTRAAKVAKPV